MGLLCLQTGGGGGGGEGRERGQSRLTGGRSEGAHFISSPAAATTRATEVVFPLDLFLPRIVS